MSNAASIRLINASADLALSAAMKSQIAKRSTSAWGLFSGLFAMLGRQALSSFRLDSLEHIADLLGRPTVYSLLDFGAQRFELCLPALFDQSQPIAQDLARRRIAAALDQAFDELFKMLAYAVAARHRPISNSIR